MKIEFNTTANKGKLTVLSFLLGVAFMATNVQAVEIKTSLPIVFQNDTEMPTVEHVANSNNIKLVFHNASNLKQDPRIRGNQLISSISSKKLGNDLVFNIETKYPVKYEIIKDENNYSLNLEKSNVFQSNASLPVVEKEKIDYVVVENTPVATPLIPANISEVKQVVPVTNVVTPQVVEFVAKNEVDNINIKAQGKTTKITIDLKEATGGINVKKSGNLLIVDLPNIKIPEEFQKNINTLSLNTVVQNIDIATQKDSGRLVVSHSDKWEYSEYQMDKKFVIEITPIERDVAKAEYKGKKLTLNFQNMDVRSILQVIADFTGLNVMSSDAVSGAMTIRLKDVPWDQALDLVLEARNLHKKQEGNVIWIATKQEIADKNKSQLELLNQEADLAPLNLEFFQLNHYKAREMKEIIEGRSSGAGGAAGLSLLSKKGSVGLDIRNNKLFIQDTEKKLDEIAKIIKKLDVASKQVLIEAKLVVVDDTFQRDFGARFGFGAGRRNGTTQYGLSNNATDATAIANGSNPTGAAFNSPVLGGGSIGFTILNAVTGNMLNVELSALEQNNRGKVISNPRLLTADNKKAEIKQGTEIPYVTPGTGNSPASVAFKEAVLSLGVTPQVSPNGRISMDLDITKDTVGQLVNVQGGGQVPSIDTRRITTQVTVSNGQTVVLGGIYEITNREDISKVPFLGSIPWVGNLFKNSSRSNDKVELLIFITPHVIEDEDLDAININEQANLNEINLRKK